MFSRSTHSGLRCQIVEHYPRVPMIKESLDPAEGYHTKTYKTGHVYTGQLHRGKRHGEGTMYFPNDSGKYVGRWRDGKQDGRGVEHLADGSTYDGHFVAGCRNGQGTYTFAAGKGKGEVVSLDRFRKG